MRRSFVAGALTVLLVFLAIFALSQGTAHFLLVVAAIVLTYLTAYAIEGVGG